MTLQKELETMADIIRKETGRGTFTKTIFDGTAKEILGVHSVAISLSDQGFGSRQMAIINFAIKTVAVLESKGMDKTYIEQIKRAMEEVMEEYNIEILPD